MTTADDIVTHARTWIGVPWRHQGRGTGADRAVDCAGLLLVVARHFDLPNGDLQGYRRDPGVKFVQNVRKHTLPFDHPIHGAIGIFTDTVQPCHVGIFAADRGKLSVIHSEVGANRCHEEFLDADMNGLMDRLIAVRLYKEVDYGV